jgi:hypothetical protein
MLWHVYMILQLVARVMSVVKRNMPTQTAHAASCALMTASIATANHARGGRSAQACTLNVKAPLQCEEPAHNNTHDSKYQIACLDSTSAMQILLQQLHGVQQLLHTMLAMRVSVVKQCCEPKHLPTCCRKPTGKHMQPDQANPRLCRLVASQHEDVTGSAYRQLPYESQNRYHCTCLLPHLTGADGTTHHNVHAYSLLFVSTCRNGSRLHALPAQCVIGERLQPLLHSCRLTSATHPWCGAAAAQSTLKKK